MKLNEIQDESVLNDIFNNEIIIFEDIQGSKIYVNWNGSNFTIKSKSLSSDPINMIDLAMQNYYNNAISFFNNLDNRVKGLINKKWWFCFEFFPDNQPANIEYNRVPKNNLVLTSICKGNKFDYTIDELEEYARLLDVDVIPVIFKGKLNEKVIEAIKYFLNTSESDLEYVFGEKSFSYFFYKILSPQTQNSFLMNEDFQKNVEKLIIRIDGKDVSFEILNPLYKRISDTNSTDFVEIYTLILVNFLNFCQSIDFNQIKVKGNKRDEVYIYLICKLFNMYLSEVKDDIANFQFTVPEFFDKDKFRINTELIPNKMTKQFISEDKKFEYIFKVILGSFNKKRKKPIGVFTEGTINIFNNFVQMIQEKIDEFFNKKSEIELTRSGLIDFSQWFDVKYDVDAEENVYPDVYNELEKGKEEKKKGDKGGKGEYEKK
jgi:uncharacterized protein YggU (UPF0235/DUF167 family)